MVTRHSLPTVNKINPFASLSDKFWVNYALLCVISILLSILIHLKILHKLSIKTMIGIIISPSESYWGAMIKSGVLIPCLIAFTFWTFNTLYGVDLAVVLVGKNH